MIKNIVLKFFEDSYTSAGKYIYILPLGYFSKYIIRVVFTIKNNISPPKQLIDQFILLYLK